ncbi:hypothetical protein ES703_55050 [subsurface metagenome]
MAATEEMAVSGAPAFPMPMVAMAATAATPSFAAAESALTPVVMQLSPFVQLAIVIPFPLVRVVWAVRVVRAALRASTASTAPVVTPVVDCI